jgi:hypothetical protein
MRCDWFPAWLHDCQSAIIYEQRVGKETFYVLPVEDASADTQRVRGNGSRLYEVNIWMWRYGRGRSRMVSIAEAERIRSERLTGSESIIYHTVINAV